jgi:hypothetical protein
MAVALGVPAESIPLGVCHQRNSHAEPKTGQQFNEISISVKGICFREMFAIWMRLVLTQPADNDIPLGVCSTFSLQ